MMITVRQTPDSCVPTRLHYGLCFCRTTPFRNSAVLFGWRDWSGIGHGGKRLSILTTDDISPMIPRAADSTMHPKTSRVFKLSFLLVAFVLVIGRNDLRGADDSNRARTDGSSRYLHHIHLYDASNKRITADSTTPYSSIKTCGRCHDYEAISHGWHFNAFLPEAQAGREGEPWIWTDARTGTQLPLSYRSWEHTFSPQKIGITAFEMTRQFGGRIPGGGMGHAPPLSKTEGDEASESASRWPLTGSLEIDCMVCHAVSGAYDFNARRDQIDGENFAWAATAGAMLGTVKGEVARIKTGSDSDEESVQKKLPVVTYDASQFAEDATVFMDLIRQPSNNACYACHSNALTDENGILPRWTHDQDVHLQSGMKCTDCHRNGIDHHIVRGFSGEQHPSGRSMTTLSCAGCHLGADFARDSSDEGTVNADLAQRAGRLGSPKPLHKGLPPVHFEKLSCTACHGGPVPRSSALGTMTSLAHGLGSKGHRTGEELPRMAAPVYAPGPDGKVAPHRVMWPAFWATVESDAVNPIHPDQVYEVTRRALRVRKDFQDEVMNPKLSSSDLKKVLGEERGRTKSDEWTEEEKQKVESAQQAEGQKAFDEKVAAALEAIEKELRIKQAAYVTSGVVYVRGEEDKLKKLDASDSKAVRMVAWPMAHNVRPAGWSLGVAGCTECHSDSALIFSSTVSPIGPGPESESVSTMAELQGIDPNQRLAWNQMFSQRAIFKYVIAGSLGILMVVLLIGVGATFARRRFA